MEHGPEYLTQVAPRHGSTGTVRGHWQNDQRLPITNLQNMSLGQPFALPQGASRISLAPPSNPWKPRSGIGFAAWASDTKNRISTCDLLDTSCCPPPTLEHMAVAYPGCGHVELMSLHGQAMAEYRDENTALFYIVMNTIDLSGIRQETDLAFIERRFHFGSDRDGQGLYQWLLSFGDHSDTGAQDRLQVALAQTTLTDNPTYWTCTLLEEHCIKLLNIWTKIEGNHISVPASFNARLLSSIPPQVKGELGSLRSWLADKITDGAPFLSDPELLIDKLLAHARTLGMHTGKAPQRGPEGTNMGTFVVKDLNDCAFCDFGACTAGKDKSSCLIFTTKPLPSTLSQGQRTYAATARKYVELNKPTKLKGIRYDTIKKEVIDHLKKLEEPKQAQTVAAVTEMDAFQRWWEQQSKNASVQVVMAQNDDSVGAPFLSDLELVQNLPSDWQLGDPFGGQPIETDTINVITAPIERTPASEEGGPIESTPASAEGGPFSFDVPTELAQGHFVNMISGSPLRASRAAVDELRTVNSPSIQTPAIVPPIPLVASSPPQSPPNDTAGILALLTRRFMYLRGWLYTRLTHMDRDTLTQFTMGALVMYTLRDPLTRPFILRFERLRKFLLQVAHRLVNGLAQFGTRLAWFAGATSSALPNQ